MEVQQVLDSISQRNKQLLQEEETLKRDIVFDVGNLTIWDPHAIALPKPGKARENYIKKFTQEDVQIALNQMYNQNLDNGFLTLPEGTTIFPRSKPPPKPKMPTRWERFAEEKGIKSKSSKNRDKLQYDETTKKWVPRFGYKKVQNEEEKDWCIELPDNADPNVDYFAKRDEEKKERIAKNKFQQLRNMSNPKVKRDASKKKGRK